jgi:hypothetical protein
MMPALAELAGAFVLGLTMGLTACAASCLPFIGTWVFAGAGGGRVAAGDLSLFLAGRLLGYAVLGAAAGYAGDGLIKALNGPAGHIAIGLAGIAAGAALLARPRQHRPCHVSGCGMPPLALGVALSLSPCVPLATLLAAAALSGDIAAGAGMGVTFGLGAAVTPMILAVPLLGMFGHRIATRPGLGTWVRLGGAMVLVALSARRLVLAI